ncbi:MAG: tetratricopeptide repeat protein, partial [Actinomycetia bacterium]|nr:tetratricopeptide repeat protein [Actinomycetes bacterium]
KAVSTFNKILTDYPDSTIDSVGEIVEKGHTGAKAYLGIGNCYIATNELEKAVDAFKAISKYPDSYTEVKEGDNTEKSKEFFYAIGLSKIIDIYENVLKKKDEAETFKNILQEKYPGSIFIRS